MEKGSIFEYLPRVTDYRQDDRFHISMCCDYDIAKAAHNIKAQGEEANDKMRSMESKYKGDGAYHEDMPNGTGMYPVPVAFGGLVHQVVGDIVKGDAFGWERSGSKIGIKALRVRGSFYQPPLEPQSELDILDLVEARLALVLDTHPNGKLVDWAVQGPLLWHGGSMLNCRSGMGQDRFRVLVDKRFMLQPKVEYVSIDLEGVPVMHAASTGIREMFQFEVEFPTPLLMDLDLNKLTTSDIDVFTNSLVFWAGIDRTHAETDKTKLRLNWEVEFCG